MLYGLAQVSGDAGFAHLLSLVLVVRGAGLTTANIALMAGAFTGLPVSRSPTPAA